MSIPKLSDPTWLAREVFSLRAPEQRTSWNRRGARAPGAHLGHRSGGRRPAQSMHRAMQTPGTRAPDHRCYRDRSCLRYDKPNNCRIPPAGSGRVRVKAQCPARQSVPQRGKSSVDDATIVGIGSARGEYRGWNPKLPNG